MTVELNSTSPAEWLTVLNNNVNGFLGLGLIIMIFIVILVALIRFSFGQALATAGFITTVLSLFLLSMGLISQGVIYILILLTIVGVFFLYYLE